MPLFSLLPSARSLVRVTSYKPWIATFSDADAVFIGKVHSVIPLGKAKRRSADFRGDHTVTFEVTKHYKGIEPSTRLISLYSDYNSTSCSFGVDDRKGPRKGEDWIVFADKTTTSQMFFGGSCNASRKIRSNKQLRAIEEQAFKFPQRQGILGSVVLNYMELAKDIEVTLEGEGILETKKVDDDGYYWFPLERPGKYSLSAKIPFRTTLIMAAQFPESFESLGSETKFTYVVDLKEDVFHYNEVNVNAPHIDPFSKYRITDRKNK